MENMFSHSQDCITRALSVLDPTPAGVVKSLLNLQNLQKALFNTDLSLSSEQRAQLLDLICNCFQNFLSDLKSGALSQAKKHLYLYARHLPLISSKQLDEVCAEIDAMDKYGKWYQAFVIRSGPQSSLIHFMVRFSSLLNLIYEFQVTCEFKGHKHETNILTGLAACLR